MADRTARTMLAKFRGVVVDGTTPPDLTPQEFRIPRHYLDRLVTSESKDRAAWFIPDIVDSPIAIWQGLDRANQQGSLCYAGFPSGHFFRLHRQDYMEDYLVDKDPAKYVFVSYVDPHCTVFDWEWLETDTDGSGYPLNHKTRFGRILWTR